jgi:hypothetical protein
LGKAFFELSDKLISLFVDLVFNVEDLLTLAALFLLQRLDLLL